MPRPKGPATIKFLDATKQDEVEMRRALLRGGALPELQTKLDDLYSAKAKLLQRRSRLAVRIVALRGVLKRIKDRIKGSGKITLLRAKIERRIGTELPTLETKFQSAESQLRSIQKHIDETQKRIEKLPLLRKRKAAFDWQEKAVQLIGIHKYLQSDDDCVTSTHGATITTDELQKQLLAEGFNIGERELRRFMRQCGVTGIQGKRTDLTSPSKPQFASLLSAVPEKPKLNRELLEQRRAEQAALTPAQFDERIREHDAAYDHYCDTPEGRAEQDHKKRLARFYAKHPNTRPN